MKALALVWHCASRISFNGFCLRRRSSSVGLALLLPAAMVLNGCRIGPDYHRPAALGTNTLPASFSATGAPGDTNSWKTAEPAAHLARGSWWEVFQDAELNRLEAIATASNQELVAAAARFEQARTSVTVARSALLPTLAFDPSYSRRRTSGDQPPGGRTVSDSATFHTFTLPLDAGWELDLWGRVRRQVESASAQLDASADDREALKLLIQAEVATDFFGYRSTQAEADVLQRSLETYRHSYELTRNRRAGGVATDLDVAQAEAQLRGVEAEIPAVELRRLQLLHALATLCGQSAIQFEIRSSAPAPTNLPVTPDSLPSELLERRPDIAAAERRMAAANAEIGVAQTAFYPRVRLTGSAGLQSIGVDTLFDWPSRFWAIGPSVELPLFTGGRNRALLANARAAYDEAVAHYRQQVLSAFQDVEDQLAAGRLIRTELEAQQAALVANRRTLEIATNRYRAGLVTFLEVAIAQTAALLRERTVVQLQAERLAASAGLIKAIGGGFAGG